MSQLDEVREQFIQLLERITEQRGFQPIHGRILAGLFLSDRSLTQKELADWSGYSVSAVSRTLDQMVALGSVRRYKEPGRRSFQYELVASLPSLFVGPIERWLQVVDASQNAFRQLVEKAQQVDVTSLLASQVKEVNLLTTHLQQLVDTLQTITPMFQELVNRLQTLSD
jgi:DNA-binding transcriptional regulator GbsR (MarR family)